MDYGVKTIELEPTADHSLRMAVWFYSSKSPEASNDIAMFTSHFTTILTNEFICRQNGLYRCMREMLYNTQAMLKSQTRTANLHSCV